MFAANLCCFICSARSVLSKPRYARVFTNSTVVSVFIASLFILRRQYCLREASLPEPTSIDSVGCFAASISCVVLVVFASLRAEILSEPRRDGRASKLAPSLLRGRASSSRGCCSAVITCSLQSILRSSGCTVAHWIGETPGFPHASEAGRGLSGPVWLRQVVCLQSSDFGQLKVDLLTNWLR